MKRKKMYALLVALILVFSSFSMVYAEEKNESTIEETDGENSIVSTQEVIQDKITDAEIEAYADNVVLNVEKPADFVFIIDSTGSMRGYINSVKENLTAFVKYLQEKNVDVQIAVVDYKDITYDGLESTVVHSFDETEWTKDVNKVIEEFNDINVGGGGDDPETPTDAFEKIINFSTWRDDAQRFVFLLTDADYKSSSDDANLKDMDEYINIFRGNNIHTTVVGLSEYQNIYEKLYSLTGGKFIDITSSDYYKIMIEIADWVFDSMQDSDGDGLPDEWETNGVDTDGDGVIDLHLEQMGADPNVPDVFVELDWMYQPKIEGSFFGIKYEKQKEINLKPSSEALRMVYEQFKKHGINLHLDAGSDSIDYVTGKEWGTLSGANAIDYVNVMELGENNENWNQYAINNFSRVRWNVFRYAMFINKYAGKEGKTTSSGIAERPGQFMLIADVDGWISGNDTSLAGTFMHELGHTLGLQHGGNESVNNKINYLSVMNYLFQTTGLVGTNEINYSDYELPAIDEENLDENMGIDPEGLTEGKTIGTKWKYNKKMLFWTKDKDGSITSIARKALDYNQNGKLETGLNIDLNGDEETKYAKSINDWQYLSYTGGLIGGQGSEAESLNIDVENSLDELTYEEAVENGLLGNPGSCEIEKIGPAKVYINVENEKLTVTINNLSTEKATPTVRVESDILENSYEERVEIEGNTEKINSIELEIPIKKALKEGTYSVECEVESENGTVERKNETITVCKANTVEISVGETLNLSIDDSNSNLNYSWRSSNECIDITDDGELIGRYSGSSVITGTNLEGDQIKFIVNVSENNADQDNSEKGDLDNADKPNPDNTDKDTDKDNPDKDTSGNVDKPNSDDTDKNNSSSIDKSNPDKDDSNNVEQINLKSNAEKKSASNAKNVKTSANVKTGDQSHVMIYIVGMIVSILIIAGVLIFRRKKH